MSISASGAARIALVTGGGTGVGRAISRGLGAAGYTVVISGRRADVLEKAASELGRETGAAFFAVSADVGNPDSVRGLF
ncbi:SDR family NAD(P)-dependent oxidoreductase, partial [Pseudomonas sp. BGM005]|nr:SDR family NAD(P)-dependent oxidoreductase [Pseudomonas sp. BG5]